MKKTFLLAAAAAAMIASPAFAQYADGVATYEFRAPVQNFCKFGNVGNGETALRNASAFDRAISVDEGDRGFQLDLQKTTDNTNQGASGAFRFNQAQCNTPFNVTYTSTSGGLASSYTGAQQGFADKLAYNISFGPDGALSSRSSVVQVSQGGGNLLTNSNPYAGAMRFSFTVPASSDKLLAGSYTDTVVITMSPVTGGQGI